MADAIARGLPRWEPLGSTHNRAAFLCSRHPELESFIKVSAGQMAKRKISATHVMLVDSDTEIAGYYTLSSARIDMGDLTEDLAKKLPKFREGMPATLIGMLAVHDKYQGQGWGKRLLMNALATAHSATQQVASAFVIVRAIDDEAFRFYKKFGFIAMPSDSRRLFLPMATIAKLTTKG